MDSLTIIFGIFATLFSLKNNDKQFYQKYPLKCGLTYNRKSILLGQRGLLDTFFK